MSEEIVLSAMGKEAVSPTMSKEAFSPTVSKEAIIIGGSIAGLMCGIMLKHHGYTVTIIEKNTTQSRQSYDAGINIGPAVEEFLRKHDRVKRDFAITCPPGAAVNIHGESSLQRGQTLVLTSWALFVSILRANFDGLCSKAVPNPPLALEGDGPAEFRTGAQVTDILEDDGKVLVTYKNVTHDTTGMMWADMVIVADGSTSSMREILMPEVKREYLGYICWRGTVSEELIDRKWNEHYSGKATLHFMNYHYLLNYTIPSDDGDLTLGKRMHNWVWYSQLPEGCQEMEELFKDRHGKTHRSTVPRGLIQREAWAEKKTQAALMLPEGLATIVKKSLHPFVTKVYTVASPKALFFGGKVFVVGDAQNTLRPNTGMSGTHAAFDCNTLEQVIEGKMTPEQWETTVLHWAAAQHRFAAIVSSYGLYTNLAVLWNAGCWLLLLLGQKIGLA